MRYLGGKSRIAKALAAEIDKVRRPGQVVWDAFCGGLSMSVALSKNGPVWSTDANAALINLYLAVQQGWDPPAFVSREEYAAAKALPDTDPRKAYIGLCASFGGKWFGGYARGESRNWADEGRRGLLRDIPKLRSFACIDFLACDPRPVDAVLYLDPPYAGTTGYAGVGCFAAAAFVERCRQWAAFAPVFVSEYSFPIGECIWSAPLTKRAGIGPGDVATERLYYLPKGSVW